MRGKVREKLEKTREARITPAHAGKSTTVRYWSDVPWDHPRPCGEKYHGTLLE